MSDHAMIDTILMKNNSFYTALIQELQKIYARLLLTVLHVRMDRYQQQAVQSFKPYTTDIKSPLMAVVNTISHRAKTEPELHRAIDPYKLSATKSPASGEVATTGLGLHGIDKDNFGELSRYFKDRSNGAELHPGIEARLEQSTLEHIQAAIRCARRADSSHAKMHVGIASSACKELAHYMPEDQYLKFVGEIAKQLDELAHFK